MTLNCNIKENYFMSFEIRTDFQIDTDQVIELYRANKWSSAEKPEILIPALKNSFYLVCAYDDERLIGLGNAISDGHLVVYYPHLLVHPEYHKRGIGKMIMDEMQEKFAGFHQQMLTADKDAITFYERCGFKKAGGTQSMWIYAGNDH